MREVMHHGGLKHPFIIDLKVGAGVGEGPTLDQLAGLRVGVGAGTPTPGCVCGVTGAGRADEGVTEVSPQGLSERASNQHALEQAGVWCCRSSWRSLCSGLVPWGSSAAAAAAAGAGGVPHPRVLGDSDGVCAGRKCERGRGLATAGCDCRHSAPLPAWPACKGACQAIRNRASPPAPPPPPCSCTASCVSAACTTG